MLICAFLLATFNTLSPADAAERHDIATIRTLITEHADINASQPDGMTALHWACHHNNFELTKLLLKNGAKANSSNRYGVTPLSLACQNGNGEIVSLLLDSGADPNVTLTGNETALMTAARTGNLAPVKALLAKGAKVDAKERRGQTALMWAAAEGHPDVVQALLDAGADFRSPLPSGFTPLLLAVREGRTHVVRVLLKAGASVSDSIQVRKTGGKAPERGSTPLVIAIENGHFELAVFLLDSGADPNDQRAGFTPLHMLTWVRKPSRGDDADGDPAPIPSGTMTSLQLAEVLVAHGAKVNARLERGESGRGLISKVGATPFLMAAITGDVPYMRKLLALGADPRISNADNSTPLMAAAGLGSRAPDEEPATEADALEAVALLIELGGDVNSVDKNGETAMHGAAYKNFPKMVQFLADKGAKVDVWNHKNRWGWTPVLIAEGHRPGNNRPSPETVAALHKLMREAGLTPPPPTPRVEQKGYAPDPAK